MALVVDACEKLLCCYQVLMVEAHGQKLQKWRQLGQRWATWFLWKEGVKQWDIHCQLSAVCGEKAPALYALFIWLWSLSSGKETATLAVQDRYWPNEWLHEAIQKLPRRWQRCVT